RGESGSPKNASVFWGPPMPRPYEVLRCARDTRVKLAAALQRRLAFVGGAGVGRRLGAIGHAVVANDGADAQPVVGKDAGAPCGLGCAVAGVVAPRTHGFLVAPEGEREELR